MDEEIPPLVSAADWAKTPPEVRQTFVSLVDLVRELSAQVQELRAQLTQTSHNSSKPPSSDPPSAPPPPAARVARGRKRGGQPNHSDQQRPLLPEEQLDAIVALLPTTCSRCQSTLAPDLPIYGPVWIYQIVELPPITPTVTEYQQQSICCPACHHAVTADLPTELPPGAFGPRLSALIGLLHGGYHLSMRTTAALLEDVCGVRLRIGSVAASCACVSEVLAPVDTTIQNHIQQHAQLWIDETGWKEGAQRGWLWVAVSPHASCYRIQASRGQGALWKLLGEAYGGIVHSDRAGVYHALPNRQRQLCWAHIIRNLHGLADYQHAESRWAGALLNWTKPLFDCWRAYQCGIFDQIALHHALLPVRLAMHELLSEGARAPWEKLQATCTDLLRHWDALWTFTRVEGLEPTNNRAERALRPAVIWRKSCYGTQSESGSRFVERLLSVQATCAQQGCNLFAFLTETVRAAWAHQPAPVLITTS